MERSCSARGTVQKVTLLLKPGTISGSEAAIGSCCDCVVAAIVNIEDEGREKQRCLAEHHCAFVMLVLCLMDGLRSSDKVRCAAMADRRKISRCT